MWVLQIDDDEDDLEIFGSAIQLFDPALKFSGAVALKDALALFATEGCAIPDVIFLDINMPRYSGFDCYAIFKKDRRFINTRFIFLSTSIDVNKIPAGSACMKKQYSLAEYVSQLRTHLPPPLTSARDSHSTYRYQPSLSLYDLIRLGQQRSQASAAQELHFNLQPI
jgi:CheY-like chemotaxis protein